MHKGNLCVSFWNLFVQTKFEVASKLLFEKEKRLPFWLNWVEETKADLQRKAIVNMNGLVISDYKVHLLH